MKKLLIYLSICLLTGCGTGIGGLIVTKAHKQKELEELKAKHDKELQSKVVAAEQEKDKVIDSKNKQITAGANAFYAADLTFQTIITPTRTDLITNNYVREGWTALGKINPDAETILKINERLKIELDENKTTLAQLKETHDKQIIAAQKLADQSRESEEKLKKLTGELERLKTSHAEVLSQKKDEIISLGDKIAALERERADKAADITATKAKLAMIVGGLALACLAGAIWSPVFKQKFGLAAASLGVISVGILYIQAWHVALVGGVLLLGLIGWAVWEHFKEREAATDVYRAIQAVKTESRETFDHLIKPKLQEWVSKYDKQGRIVPNTRAEQHIDDRLREVGDK